jgi:hypothetical protein
MKFAKLFEFENDKQVLFEILETGGIFEIKQKTLISGREIETYHPYISFDEALLNLNKITESKARIFLETMEVLF